MWDKKITITFIRCGMTLGAKEGRFVGVLDEPLLEESKELIKQRAEAGVYPVVSRIYSSTQSRCLETPYIIYPGIPVIATAELRAFDYGEYTDKTYFEVVEDPRFVKAAKEVGPIQYPDGENTYTFQARTAAAFQKILSEIDQTKVTEVAIISHKETIMPILRRYCIPRSNYGDYKLDYGGGITVEYDSSTGIGRILKFL